MKQARTTSRSFRRVFPRGTPSLRTVLNAAIVLLGVLVVYLAYSLFVRLFVSPPVEVVRDGDPRERVIQVDVLNGCGAAGAGNTFTAFLRSRGYDVVEIRNHTRYDIRETLIVDRRGNLSNAEKVAQALGIGRRNIVQQLNPDYFVDVSVVIGGDFQSLKPSL